MDKKKFFEDLNKLYRKHGIPLPFKSELINYPKVQKAEIIYDRLNDYIHKGKYFIDLGYSRRDGNVVFLDFYISPTELSKILKISRQTIINWVEKHYIKTRGNDVSLYKLRNFLIKQLPSERLSEIDPGIIGQIFVDY